MNTSSYFFLCEKKKVSKKETSVASATFSFPKDCWSVRPSQGARPVFSLRKEKSKQKRNDYRLCCSSLFPKNIYISPSYEGHISGDPCGNRTRVTGVRGRCLNRLTNGPSSSAPPEALSGAPSGTRTRDPLIKSQLLYQLS